MQHQKKKSQHDAVGVNGNPLLFELDIHTRNLVIVSIIYNATLDIETFFFYMFVLLGSNVVRDERKSQWSLKLVETGYNQQEERDSAIHWEK